MPRPDRPDLALVRADRGRQPVPHRGRAGLGRRWDHPAGQSFAWASWRDSAAACRARLTCLPAWGGGRVAAAARRAELVRQRQAVVGAAGPCPEKTKTGCYQGAVRRYDAQPVPGRLASRPWNRAVAAGRGTTHRYHRDEASAPEEPGLEAMAVRPAGWLVRRLATGLLVPGPVQAVRRYGQAGPAPAGPPEATVARRSTARQPAERWHHRTGWRLSPPPWHRPLSLPRRW